MDNRNDLKYPGYSAPSHPHSDKIKYHHNIFHIVYYNNTNQKKNTTFEIPGIKRLVNSLNCRCERGCC